MYLTVGIGKNLRKTLLRRIRYGMFRLLLICMCMLNFPRCITILSTVITNVLYAVFKVQIDVFSIDQDTLYVAVSNKQDTFSFINAIQVANEATFVVAADIEASTVIKSKTVSLHTGDNVYYVLVENGRDVQLYKTIIRRKAIYKVCFETNGGTECNLQWVEEGGLAKEPVTTKTGYTFKGWNFDFETPVTNDTVISANWTANVYTVTYDVNGGNLTDIDTAVTYDGAYAFAVPERTGYSFNGWRI